MSRSQSRSRNSLYNALSAMSLTLVNGLLTIVVTRFILIQFGSDFNGLNSTANQIVNVLMILEGGFTLASNVALFAPLTEHNDCLANGILSATKKKFHRVGLLFLGLGFVIAIIYALIVNSSLSREFVATIIMMTVVPSAFNLYYAATYRALVQAQQREYIINVITLFTVSGGHIANILMMLNGGSMWMVRFNTMIFALLNSLLIGGYVKRRNSFIDLKVPPRMDQIKGTGDVMAQKITGVIYNSAPIVFLSVSPSGGTLLASVYAVYNSVFVMLKSLLHGVIDAPRLSFGQLLTSRKREDVWPVFAQYEFIAFSAIFVLLSTCGVLILPFIRLYTAGVTDVEYYNTVIALLMVAITTIEMMHIPSGHLINMAGEFRISRNFQIIATVVLVVAMCIGGALWGVYGMLTAVLLCAVLLALMEMGYVHLRFFKKKLLPLFRLILPLLFGGVVLCWLELKLPLDIDSYFVFCCYGLLFCLVNLIVAVAIGFVFNRKELINTVYRIRRLFGRKKRL